MRMLQQTPPLLRREPISETYAKTPHALDAADACGEFGTQKAGVGCLVRDAADGCKPQVDRGGSVLALFEVDAIAENNRPIER